MKHKKMGTVENTQLYLLNEVPDEANKGGTDCHTIKEEHFLN